MSRTTFRNAYGLPDPGQVTTARDMATLGRALQEHHPEYFSYFATPSFVWNGRRIGNHDRLLGRVAGVNGIKTGYTRASGFNLVTSVSRNNRKLVGVVLGGETSRWRDKRMAELVDDLSAEGIDAGSRSPPSRARPRPSPPSTRRICRYHRRAHPWTRPKRPRFRRRPPRRPRQSPVSPFRLPRCSAPIRSSPSTPEIRATPRSKRTPAMRPAPAPVITGWKIQLAATPTQSSAEDILDRALSGGASVLGKASPYTEPVVRGETTLYRARFAGFAGKNEARAACAYLAKRDFDCLAISD